MNVTGAPRIAMTVNGTVPGPTLRWREGDTVTLRVTNSLDEDTSIHWHGILLPANMDGVPGLSFHGIRPGETYVVPVSRAAERDLLVSQSLRLPGTAGRVRGDGHRAADPRSRRT